MDSITEEMIAEENRHIPLKMYKEQFYRESTRKYYVPQNITKKRCFVISTNLLARRKWLSVDCSEALDSALVICERIRHNNSSVDVTTLKRQSIECYPCKYTSILQNNAILKTQNFVLSPKF